MNSPETLKLVEDHVCRFLNRLTSFNHLMTLNEQLVKHQLRSKFLIEALTLLQKRIKEKNSAKSSWIFSNEAMFSFRPCTWVEAYWKKNRAQ